MRSNFDGSMTETVVPQEVEDEWICVLAIHEASGNIYYSAVNSNEIIRCDAHGNNRAAVVPQSHLVNLPVGIALDSENNYMFWGHRVSGSHSIVRANLDGGDAAIISTLFSNLYGMTLDQPSNGILYWVDIDENIVGTIDVNGNNKRTLVVLQGDPGPCGIQVDANKIYLGNLRGKNILMLDRDSGRQLAQIFESRGEVFHLALFKAL